jgi:hypothetical protein
MKIPVIALMIFCALGPAGSEVVVRDDAQLRAAIAGLKPGAVIRIAAGTYQPGISLRDVHGTAEEPVLIEALDAAHPPVFEGGGQAWHLSDLSHVTLRGLACKGQRHNGINIDDGGDFDTPSHHVTLDHVRVEDTGPRGNFDAIKCSGVERLRILDCRISGWGGQAIDLVGCHHVEIARCVITGKPGFSQNTGPQFKGGTSDVRMHHCRLVNAGERPIQVGGSTGLDYFRPKEADFEARRIRIEDNFISGGTCAVAFTGAVDCSFTRNTVQDPAKWVLRVLQESRGERFLRCGDNRFSRNLIVFERSKVRGVVNVGPETRAETFIFEGNHWFARDEPAKSRPTLPAAEKDGVYGKDPGLDAHGRPTQGRTKAGPRMQGE